MINYHQVSEKEVTGHFTFLFLFPKDGMSIVLQVGEPSDVPPVPEDFPRCGSWSPVSDEDDKHGKDKGRKYEGSQDQIENEKPRKQFGTAE